MQNYKLCNERILFFRNNTSSLFSLSKILMEDKKKKDYIIILINIYCYLLLNYLLQLYPPLYTFHRDTLNIYPITQHAYCNFDNQLIKIQKKFIHKGLTYTSTSAYFFFPRTKNINLHKISCGKIKRASAGLNRVMGRGLVSAPRPRPLRGGGNIVKLTAVGVIR